MDLPDPTERRDRMVAALLREEPTLALLRWDPEVTILARPDPMTGIRVLAVPPDLPQDRLEYVFSMHVKAIARRTHAPARGGRVVVSVMIADDRRARVPSRARAS